MRTLLVNKSSVFFFFCTRGHPEMFSFAVRLFSCFERFHLRVKTHYKLSSVTSARVVHFLSFWPRVQSKTYGATSLFAGSIYGPFITFYAQRKFLSRNINTWNTFCARGGNPANYWTGFMLCLWVSQPRNIVSAGSIFSQHDATNQKFIYI